MEESLKNSCVNIKIVGIGGAGNNAINRMVRSGLGGIEFIAVNTDAQALSLCIAQRKIAIGQGITLGLGAGGDLKKGEEAAKISIDDLRSAISSADVVFITTGQGGGTGTGATPVIAHLAREAGALTIGVVTKPFSFEGKKRSLQADYGIENLEREVDTLITIPNDRLLEVAVDVPVVEAFKLADDILLQGVRAVTELVTEKGIVNLDFANIKEVLSNSGRALIGIGVDSSAKDRGRIAAMKAIRSPLLESSIDGATKVLVNVSGGNDLALYEVNDAVEVVARAVDPEASIVFGAITKEHFKGRIEVIVIASGFISRRQSKRSPENSTSVWHNFERYNETEVDFPTFLRNGRS